MVLVPGASSASDWWDPGFCSALSSRGHRVVRYDLRDTGESTTRPPGSPDYGGDDLVADLRGLVAVLGRGPAHVAGLSMGGALAQQLAAEHPGSVASLTLLSTTAIDPSDPAEELPGITPELEEYFEVLAERPAPADRESAFRAALADERAFGGTLPIDVDRLRAISDSVFDRSVDLAAAGNHGMLGGSESERPRLARVVAPTLVVHGTEDPLFPLEHGRSLARRIRGARLLEVPGLGHQFPPPPSWDVIVPGILRHVAAAGAPRP
ncbi:alpha/beta fold hydrolase [Herbiconiux moechotypicola]|uniref:alpha/beta fold hydrolase n=1 Tax=Herbiconiux moechotypicola TaxID=637393 RepID=UPI00217E40C3|nr:alpha/beta fold hydrolase [Herbiconiux moechotypicola]